MALERETFDLDQMALVARATQRGETVVAAHYRIPMLPSKQYPYEVVTLADLAQEEREQQAFAHLVIYERQRRSGSERLYRICLQDDVILRRIRDEEPGWLSSLLVYVLTHELVHVVRFQRAEQSFHAAHAARQREEDEVHRITLGLLQATGQQRWERLDAVYGNPVVPAQVVQRSSPLL